MSTSCDDLEAYLHEEVSDLERARFERHLVGCPRCQLALDDFMQLAAASAELARQDDRPQLGPARPPAPRRGPPRARWVLAVGAAVTAITMAAVLVTVMRTPIDAQIAGVLQPERPMRQRLPYAPLDRHRPYAPDRGARSVDEIPAGLTAKVEDRGRRSELVALYLAQGSVEQAAKLIDRARNAETSDALEIERALLASDKHPAEALHYLDGVLARSPANGVAAWNRALILSDLQLPWIAAEGMAYVAALGEPGWLVEAVKRSANLQVVELGRRSRWQAEKRACGDLASDPLPGRATVRASAAMCRTELYEALRFASSPAAALRLLPVAEALDSVADNTVAAGWVHRIAATDPTRRAGAVAAYRRLMKASDAEQPPLLDQLRANHQDDLLLDAIPQLGLTQLHDEYAALARGANDPFFLERAAQLTAQARVLAEDPLGAEVVLRRAVTECAMRDVELRCSQLHIALTDVYEMMHRPADARVIAQQGLARSQRLGLYWDERQFFNVLAEAAHFEGEDALMRAYLREATLRSPDECLQVRYAQETQAMASIEKLGFAQARRDLAASPTCELPPSLERARVTAELARIDGTAAESDALRAALVHTRELPGLTAGQQAYVDAIEGRLLAARDPAAARPLLRRAIEAADRVGPNDADAAKARHDAYTSLLVLAAAGPDHAATLALVAEASGTPLGRGCAVGVMVDAERVLVVARDAAGAIVQRFEPRARTSPALDAAALIPAPIVQAVTPCARVDVVALAPVFGLPDLLPPELAWSYRGRPRPVTTPPTRPAHVVTVADTLPPAELKLPTLNTLSLAPLPGTTQDDLRGAEATPARVVGAFAGADVIEIHTHGFIDLGVSDASLIALSRQADGRFTLGAREIANLRLPRAPLVLLEACQAAYTAPYFHEPWGLPRAFLLAGARAVIASPDKIADAEAGGFFRAVEQRILDGVDPAIALRDERRTRLARDPASWTRSVLLFD